MFDTAAVEAEIRQAFDRYEAALAANDVAALVDFFRPDDKAIRMMNDSGLYGIAAIAAFRKGRDVAGLERRLTRVTVVALSGDIGVAVAEYQRIGSGQKGAQSQVWMRMDGVWRIAAAHVSLGG